MIASINPVFQAAADNTQLGWLMGVMTLFFLTAFLVFTWWAYRPANRSHFETLGRLPLDGDDEFSGGRQ